MDRRYFLMGSAAAAAVTRARWPARTIPCAWPASACAGRAARTSARTPRCRTSRSPPSATSTRRCSRSAWTRSRNPARSVRRPSRTPQAAGGQVHRRRLDRHAQPLAHPQTIWACQAGKDVYVEKPCSHNMFEARQIVAAAAKYNRIVQHGTRRRSVAGHARGRARSCAKA